MFPKMFDPVGQRDAAGRGSWQRFLCPQPRVEVGNVLGRERLCGASARLGLSAWCQAQAEGAGSVAHAVGGVSRRGGARGLVRLEGLVESRGNAVGTVESGSAAVEGVQ